MALRAVVVALLCASCGRIAFDATPLDDPRDGVVVEDTVTLGPRVVVIETPLDETPKMVTVPEVDPERTMVLCDYRTSSASTLYMPMCELVDGTTVRITAGAALSTCIVRVQLVQLPIGSIVRRGTNDLGSGDTSASFPAGSNDPQRAFPLISQYQDVDSTTLDDRFLLTATSGANEVIVSRAASGSIVHVAWQVIEIAGTTMTSGGVGLSPSSVSVTFTISVSATTRTFIVGTVLVSSSVEEDNMFRYELIDAAPGPQARLARNGGAVAATVRYYAIESPDILVEHGIQGFGNTLSAITQTLARAVEPSRSMIVLSYSGGSVGGVADTDDIVVTGRINSTGTGFTLERNSMPPMNVSTVVAWSVVEWL
jgi:hypothetical protein